KNVKRCFFELEKSQWLKNKEVINLQEKKLRQLINHAYHHVPYYRQVMDKKGIRPSDIKTIQDLQKLPLLSKKEINNNLYFDLFSDNHNKKKVKRITTSGSTGSPFICFVDRYQLEMRWAATLRGHQMTGCNFADKQVRLWHQTIGLSFSQRFKEKIDAFLSRRKFIPVFELNINNIRAMLKTIKNYKPKLVDGYAEAFNLIAQFMSDTKVDTVNVPSILSSAQYLPPETRSKIEEQLNSSVFDKYGSREFSGIAYECEQHNGLHIVAENYIVEILKNGKPVKPGELGEVVITDLNNFCQPFVRYCIGDLAVAEDINKKCACGRGLPLIKNIQGRVQSIIVGSNGRYIPGTFFSHLFKDYSYLVQQYKIEQIIKDEINLSVVKGLRFESKKFDELLSQLYKYLGEDTKINCKYVEKINLTKVGKHQAVLSKLKLDFQSIKL
ncbi:capsular biosynthesis protein, partial [Candidatus Marinamargulisbacteria bacterium SCGC AAA071-K20]